MAKRRVQVPQRSLEWGWVGTMARDAADVTPDLRLRTCGLAAANRWPLCPNLHTGDEVDEGTIRARKRARIDTSDCDDNDAQPEHECTKTKCKVNPNCLNWLGQSDWEEDSAESMFLKANNLGRDPDLGARDLRLPVGLRNLGATCYANALLQLWFQHLAFRDGVYRCRPSTLNGVSLEKSPVYQLQMTFAGLQLGAQRAYDPVHLAESLGIQAAVQQDAQEFAKLFLDLLDQQFRAQEVESLKTLVGDQFEGTRKYANVCKTCGTRSEHPDVFHEIVIDLKPNCKLETQLQEQLREERLTGDNRYHCSKCRSLQDATRFTELQVVPRVLHFTMARFAWDDTGERKKCKDMIQFPLSIDMGGFVTPRARRQWYDLRGILLHKGQSAHYGHYESQVLDVATGRWYNFNDEHVYEIDLNAQTKKTTNSTKGTKRPVPSIVILDSDEEKEKESDDDIVEIDPPPNVQGYISSREAYMLVYARRDEQPKQSADKSMDIDSKRLLSIPDPQVHIIQRIEEMNSVFFDECTAFRNRRDALLAQFNELRNIKRDVYRSWNIRSLSERCIIVSRTALLDWLRHGLKPPSQKEHSVSLDGNLEGTAASDTDGTLWDGMDASTKPVFPNMKIIDNSDIECWHGKLDPSKAGVMKRLSQTSYEKIMHRSNCNFTPLFTPQDVCEDCVETIFLGRSIYPNVPMAYRLAEKYYAQAHPNLVDQFDEFCKVGSNDPGSVWISKAWLKDWKCKNPKMHTPGRDDPAPDSGDFERDVRCEHGGLGTSVALRRKISAKAAELLVAVFTNWKPVSCDQDECPICLVARSTSQADKRHRLAEAENEKQQLQGLYTKYNDLSDEPSDIGHRYVMVPASFMRTWFLWLSKPTENPRPASLDCSELVCQHKLLTFDPRIKGDRAALRFIEESECRKLIQLRDTFVGPTIYCQAVGSGQLITDPEICKDCRTERFNNYDTGEVTISILHADDPLPTPDAYEISRAVAPTPREDTGLKRYSLRQKARAKRRQEVIVAIRRHNLIKTVKAEIYHETKILVSCQRLFLRGTELRDDLTVAEAGVLPGDVLELGDMQIESIPLSSKKDEGFSGTLLSSGVVAMQARENETLSPTEPEPAASTVASQVVCSRCTLLNDPSNLRCEACDGDLQAL